MNEKPGYCYLRDFMDSDEAWGRPQGRQVFPHLLDFVEKNPASLILKISLRGVRKLDMSFASETIVEIARRYRGSRGVCLVDLTDPDLIENIDVAAERKEQPIFVLDGERSRIIGLQPSTGTKEALEFALERRRTRAAEFASRFEGMSIQNASMKFKQLWQQGFLLRQEDVADSGGIEFTYCAIQ
jgi:hypothetical protein